MLPREILMLESKQQYETDVKINDKSQGKSQDSVVNHLSCDVITNTTLNLPNLPVRLLVNKF